jgi:hypothetical protein
MRSWDGSVACDESRRGREEEEEEEGSMQGSMETVKVCKQRHLQHHGAQHAVTCTPLTQVAHTRTLPSAAAAPCSRAAARG